MLPVSSLKARDSSSPLLSPRLASCAAVAALVTLGGPQALSVIDRPALMRFLLRMCIPPEQGGGMVMHDGELALSSEGSVHAGEALKPRSACRTVSTGQEDHMGHGLSLLLLHRNP